MTGKGHIAYGSIAAIDTVTCGLAASAWVPEDWKLPRDILDAAISFLDPVGRFGIAGYFLAFAGILLYYIGVLLPDIDNTSTISSALRFKLPFRHRGVTHSVWAMCLFLVPSLIWSWAWVLRYVALGMLCHGLADSLSVAGWVPFYPLGNYRVVHGNTVCRKGRHLALYASDREGSETRANIIFAAASALIACGALALRYLL